MKSIEIGNYCFTIVREFVLDGLENLESLKIGEWSFRSSDDESVDGIFCISNCPNLRQLEIEDWSFGTFKYFELSNVNSLQSIVFNYENFYFAENFILKGE